MEIRHCDFCSSPEPHWMFPCRNYMIMDIGASPSAQSVGGWLSCHKCAIHVQRCDWNGLASRCAAVNPTMQALVEVLGEDEAKECMKRTWREFAGHRVGVAISFNL